MTIFFNYFYQLKLIRYFPLGILSNSSVTSEGEIHILFLGFCEVKYKRSAANRECEEEIPYKKAISHPAAE